ncbi:unnamed protein product [Adineta ricciae]|uniref:EF-hand domain-containing protein n=1 Tax=Adineta ricciae TaxID=249248 RepID=A0A814F0A2_ADIRI|nr:unnamed protein product [Adineta ricciae]
MNSPRNQASSTLAHSVCSLLKSAEKNVFSLSQTQSKTEIKSNDEFKNETSASPSILSLDKEEKEKRMGNKIIKTKKKRADLTELPDQQIEFLVSTTKFSAQQIREWHQSFIREHPSGKLNRKQFVDVYQQFYPQGKADAFCELAFKVCDHDKNGRYFLRIGQSNDNACLLLGFVDFQEFVSTISMTMSGNIEDRLNLAFDMYDINEDGLLDKKEMRQIIKLIYKMNGHKCMKQDSPSGQIVRTIMDRFDTDDDRKLTRDEFVQECLNNSDLRKFLTP